jgi:O-antigen ligase
MPTITIALIGLSISPFLIYLALKRPLIFPFGVYVMLVPFDNLLGASTTLTRVTAIVTAGVLLFSIILNRRILAPPKSWTAWALYILLASLSALWTVDANGTMLTLGMMLQLFFFYTVVAVYPAERQDVRIVGAIIVASGTLLSAIGMIAYYSGLRLENRLTLGLNGVVLDPNHVAASLLLPIALSVGTLLESRNVILRIGAAFTTFTMVPALFLTGSRGGFIALGVMLLYLALRTRFRFQILALMSLGGVASLFIPNVWDRFADKGLQGGSGRLFIWDVGKLAFKDHWLTGAGIGAFPAAYNHELLATFQPVFQGWSRPAHNALLSAAVELGILGAALLVYAWWRTWSDARGNVVIEAALIGLAVAAWFLDVLVLKYIWLAFAMAALVKNAADPKLLRGKRRAPQPMHTDQLTDRVSAWRRRRSLAPRPTSDGIAS